VEDPKPFQTIAELPLIFHEPGRRRHGGKAGKSSQLVSSCWELQAPLGDWVFPDSPALVGNQLPTPVFKPKYSHSHCVETFLQL